MPVKLVADRAPVAGLYFKPECVSISWDPVAPSTSVIYISSASLLCGVTLTFKAFVAVVAVSALPVNGPTNPCEAVIFSLEFQPVELVHLNSLSVSPFNNKPPLAAVTSVGEATLPSITNLSSTWIWSALIALILPVTFKFPNTFKFVLIVASLVVVIPPSFNNTFSIVTPESVVFSLIVFIFKVAASPSIKHTTLFEASLISKSLKFPCLAAEIQLVLPTLKFWALIVFAVTMLSFNNTLSIVTPEPLVFSLIVSVDNVPVIDISPPDTPAVPPDNNIVELLALSFTSKSLKFPCLDAEIQLVPPIL